MRNFYSTTLPDQYAYLDTWWRKRLSIVQSLVHVQRPSTYGTLNDVVEIVVNDTIDQS